MCSLLQLLKKGSVTLPLGAWPLPPSVFDRPSTAVSQAKVAHQHGYSLSGARQATGAQPPVPGAALERHASY